MNVPYKNVALLASTGFLFNDVPSHLFTDAMASNNLFYGTLGAMIAFLIVVREIQKPEKLS